MYKLYSQEIFPFVQLPFLYARFLLLFDLILKPFPSSIQNTFSKQYSIPLPHPPLLPAILKF